MASWTFYRLKSWILLQVEVKRSRCCAVHLQTSDISICPSRASCCGSHRRRCPAEAAITTAPSRGSCCSFAAESCDFRSRKSANIVALDPTLQSGNSFALVLLLFVMGAGGLQYFPYSKQVSNPMSVGLHFKRSRVTRRRGSGGGRFNTCELACL